MTVQTRGSNGCCGVREIIGISEGDDVSEQVKDIIEDLDSRDIPLLIFTATVVEGGDEVSYGQDLADYIKENKLGSVVKSRSKLNPSSGNWIRAYIWSVNGKGVRAYAKKHDITLPCEDSCECEECTPYDWD